MFPYLLPAYQNGANGISIYSAAPSLTGLVTAVVFTVIGLIILIAYSSIVWRRLAGKIRV
jgi:cytochrome bd-type quinol oxidase subunit 2